MRLGSGCTPALDIAWELNGSEFINSHFYEYCITRRISFTRSRPGNKNDGAYVEQKNWTHVRELVGYLRFDTEAELVVLNRIWELDRVFTNLLLTQQKLLSRERQGAKVIKRHDQAMTPYARLIAANVLAPAERGALTRARNRLHPGEVQRAIAALCTQLERLALSKSPAGIRPVNRSFTQTPRRELLVSAKPRRSRTF